MISYVLRLVTTVAGLAYPAYKSFKVLENGSSANRDESETNRWLTYWIVLAVFSLFEGFADVLLFWFPFYYEIKFAFVVWLQHPSTNGADSIYKKYVRKFLVENEHDIDSTIDNAVNKSKARAKNFGSAVLSKGAEVIQPILSQMVSKAAGASLNGGDKDEQIEDETSEKPSLIRKRNVTAAHKVEEVD